MLLLAAAFTGCSEDFKDWANPITNPQPEAITIPGVSASAAATNIDLAEADDDVKLISLSTATFPEGTTLDKMRIVLTPTDVEEAEPKTLQAISTIEGTFSKEALQEIIVDNYGRRPDVRSFDAQVYLDGIYNGQAAYIDAGTVNLTLIPEAPYIADAYYLIGDMGTWGNDKSMKMSHSDKDVFEDPIFTYVFTGGKEIWFAFGDAEALDAIDTGDWNQLFGTTGASEDLSGTFDRRYNLGGDHSFHVDGSAKFYRFTINALEMTYEITPLNFQEYIYEAGVNNDWGGFEQALYCADGNGTYTGFFYAMDADWTGGKGAFKFRGAANNWDNGNYGTGTFDEATLSGTLIDDGGSGNVMPEPGFYRADVNLADMTFQLIAIHSVYVVGSAVNNDWDTGVKMTYNLSKHCWECDATFTEAGVIKFKGNGTWDNIDGNWGGTMDNIINGSNDNIPVSLTGDVHIEFYPTCDTKSYCTITAK